MASYIPATGEERQAMLQAIGLTSIDQLYDVVPESVRVKDLDLPEGLSELEVGKVMAGLAGETRTFRRLPPLYPLHREDRHLQGGVPDGLHALPG